MAKNIKISIGDLKKVISLLDRETLIALVAQIAVEFPVIRQQFLEIFKILGVNMNKFENLEIMIRGGVKADMARILLGISEEEYQQYLLEKQQEKNRLYGR